MKFISFLSIPIVFLILLKIVTSINPNKPIENTIIVALLSVAGWLAKMVFTLKADEGSLKSQIRSLEKENSNFELKSQNEIDELKKKNITLQEQVSKYTHRETFLLNYSYNKKTGISKNNSTGRECCTKCLNDELIESPVISKEGKWICIKCDKPYEDPNHKSPIPYLRGQHEPPPPNMGMGFKSK